MALKLILPLLLLCHPVLSLTWTPCATQHNTTLPISCATLPVPLDYTTPTSQNITLQLLKLPAPIQPPKGTIQLNFGGPGSPTHASLVSLGPILQLLSGSAYDLVGFDPRGTGTTIPFSCTNDKYYAGNIVAEARSSKDSDTAARRLWERGRVDGFICQYEGSGNGNETAEYLGTAAVARDLISVADALEGDGLLYYWGFSYGTTLGATVAAMFPDRVGGMVLDGVQNPGDYYYALADFEEWTDTDLVFSHFFSSCIEAGKEKCALAGLNKTAAELEADTWVFLDSLRDEPIGAGLIVFDLLMAKSFLAEQLKSVAGWPGLSALLKPIVYGTKEQKRAVLTALSQSLAAQEGSTDLGLLSAHWGIHCGDRTIRTDNFDEILDAFARLSNTSRLVGDTVAWVTAHCAQWPWRAKEVYMGDFRVKTRNPMLIASTSRDSHTPLRSALNISAGFEGSRVLEVNGSGHAIINAPSVCGFRALVAYWINGTLPEGGNLCQTAKAFDTYTWKNVFEEVGLADGSESPERRAAYKRSLR
ncbi:hypothetical protein OQA88_9001 [Cercophora sp. LCS_1]